MNKVKGVIRNSLCLSVFVVCCLFSAVGQAAGSMPIVSWAGSIFVSDAFNHELLDSAGKERIQRALTSRLQELNRRGELPFILEEGTNLDHLTTRQGEETGADIGIIPVVTLGTSFDVAYHLWEDDLYRSDVFAGLSVMLCTIDDNGDGKRTIKPLGIVPLYGREQNKSNNAITLAEKKEAFVSTMERLISQNLEFASQRNIKKNLSEKRINFAETWQVSKTSISSQRAREAIGGALNPTTKKRVNSAELRKLRSVMAHAYTSIFQKNTKNIVLLPGDNNIKLTDSIGDALRADSADSTVFTLERPEPSHTIELDLYSVATGVLTIAKGRVEKPFQAYQVWLRTTTDGKAAEYTDKELMPYLESRNVNMDVADGTMYKSLALKLVMENGAKK